MKVRIVKQDCKRDKNRTIVKIITCIRTDDNILVPSSVSCFKGIAKCSNDERYDYKIGRRIALARAEVKAFKYYSKILKGFANKHKHLYDSSTALYTKLDKQIAHNTEFIKSLIEE